jgi:SAM-dependent methyltransferase
VARFLIPIEFVGGLFFLLIALVFVGLGQELGRGFDRLPHRLHAYAFNILGSLVGIVLFAGCSWLELPPIWWYAPVVLGMSYFLAKIPVKARPALRWAILIVAFVDILAMSNFHSGLKDPNAGASIARAIADSLSSVAPAGKTDRNDHPNMHETLWSPYYRTDYRHAPVRGIGVNLIGHQQMVSREDLASAYALPHLLNRDSGGAPFAEVLIIGAGSGNDVSRALQWGARHVDAVEIDPLIHRLGLAHHPDKPYQDPRVTVHPDDGRNFLRSTDRQYDLVIYALVDSLVLHSSYSNIRLESFLFTQQAFADVKRRLKPGGMFVMYNFFRQGWLVARLHQSLKTTFGVEPLVLSLPYQESIEPEQSLSDRFTVFCTGDTERLRSAFARKPDYWLEGNRAPGPATANGFEAAPPREQAAEWRRYGLAQVVLPTEPLRLATDDWPFLYLREPMIPDIGLRGIAVMAALALLLLFVFGMGGAGGTATGPAAVRRGPFDMLDWRMFFLGAGFMLIETKAVVQMALLFGSTWMVNSVVFFAVLLMILAANICVIKFRPRNLAPYYLGLLLALAANCLIPLDFFLGLPIWLQALGACLLVFTPVLFAGVIFPVSFERTADPGRALGANIAGAMLGGLAEYASMLVGFQYLVLLAMAFYALSAIFRTGARQATPA